ncbi:MAG: 30S ribosomal protein S17 [Candidatus Brockarchaeota archaeon]|nr:30S ribosomal protein S17 [Candidatus Brockarchaeota archaeon]
MSFLKELKVSPPETKCSDKKCPFHGDVRIRGSILEGVVVSDRMRNTVIVMREYLQYIPKYKRYMRKRSRIPSHNPPCIAARTGDRVIIGESRPLSKTVHFVVLGKVK